MGGGKKKQLPPLNKFMHPRNPYKTLPSFKELAIHYPDFRAYCTFDFRGKAFLDFKKSEAVRALTTCLLHKDFGLKVNIPDNRLVPTLPLRMNYLLWIEDLLNLTCHKSSLGKMNDNITGIDIGTGATCVYPLLGSKKFGWNFVATETDSVSFDSAMKNVAENELEKKILVKQSAEFFDILQNDIVKEFLQNVRRISKETVAPEAADSDPSSCKQESKQESYLIDFTMCNPPFFSSEVEMDTNHNNKKETRSQPRSVSTGSAEERVTDGGEISFVDKLIEKSIQYKDSIKIFSTLVGKKSDVKIIINHIKEKTKGLNVCVTDTEFCQGRTMRWGIAWSFSDIPLEKVISKKQKMSQKPYVLQIPRSMMAVYSIQSVWSQIQSWLKDIKIKPNTIKLTKYYMFAIVKAYKPTWLHQRQKRRQKTKRENGNPIMDRDSEEESSESPIKRRIENEESEECISKRRKLQLNVSNDEESLLKSVPNDKFLGVSDKNLNDNEEHSNSNEKNEEHSAVASISESFIENNSSTCNEKCVKSGLECYLKCSLELKQTEALISLQMNFIGGIGKKDALHQLLQTRQTRHVLEV
ncbi:Methyltransferase-like protein 16 [Armadillidium vulgare]|nr:Methyltransferase-like protein 16 [Armadillidium vulgare]